MVKVIPFSGSCLSGKTTTMFDLKLKLENEGYKIAIAGEPIREILDELKIDIDQLRNDADAFLKVQNKVLERRIKNETFDIDNQYKDYDFLFIDRSAADVFFYVSFYFDKKLLKTDKQTEEYTTLLSAVKSYVDESGEIYSKVLLFKPLEKIIINDDSYRPKDISEEKKNMEYQMIKMYNQLFFNMSKLITVNMNESTELERLYKILITL